MRNVNLIFLMAWTDNLYIFYLIAVVIMVLILLLVLGISLFCLLTVFYHVMTVQFSASFIPAQALLL